MRAGFQSRFLMNFVGLFMEAAMFQQLLRKQGFQFMNLFETPTSSASLSTKKALFFAGLSSFATTTLLHPLYFYNQRITMADLQKADLENPLTFFRNVTTRAFLFLQVLSKEGVSGIFKGYALNLVRNVSRNVLALSVLWTTAA
jgi:hypothetical protein